MELLEYLASRSGCVYLSDLKFLPADKQNFPFLREVSLEYFPEKEWREAVWYLYRQTADNAVSAKELLMCFGTDSPERMV